jgi:hypothetical protein
MAGTLLILLLLKLPADTGVKVGGSAGDPKTASAPATVRS